MYYQNGNYMQDLNYYNQMPNYQPCVNYPNQNSQMPMGGMMQPNFNTLYPAVYRIISPVVRQVLSNQNRGYLTEETFNNMVDTVYNIVEGDVNLGNQTRNNASNSSNENTNNCERNSPTPRQTTPSSTASQTNSQNNLLKDLIKIMILNEITCQRQTNSNNMMMQNPNQPMFF